MSVHWSDEQVREAIVQSFVGERFTVPLSELQKTRAGRRRTWISMAALATAAAVVVGVLMVGGDWRGDARPIGPAATSAARPVGTPAYFLDIAQAEARCRSAGLGALQQDPEIPAAWKGKLPPKVVGLAANGFAASFVFRDDRVMVECTRFGEDGLNVGVVDISDGTSAPWTHASEIPTTTFDDGDRKLTFVTGWAPKTTTDISFTTPDIGSTSVVTTLTSSGTYFMAWLPEIIDSADFMIVVTTVDSIITKVGEYPATSTPR
jgi:hypothetical protein